LPEGGRLITFDDVAGAGKSTQLRLAAATLRRRGFQVVQRLVVEVVLRCLDKG
jgi:thymidylate kinase